MLKIKAVKHGKHNYNRYCGPGAISAITGITAENAAKRIADHKGYSQAKQKSFAKNAKRTGKGYGVVGTSVTTMRSVLRDLGYKTIEQIAKPSETMSGYDFEVNTGAEPRGLDENGYLLPCQTLTQWDNNRKRTTDLYLIALTTHYVVVQGDKIVDNQIITPRSLAGGKHYRRARVQQVFRITKSVA